MRHVSNIFFIIELHESTTQGFSVILYGVVAVNLLKLSCSLNKLLLKSTCLVEVILEVLQRKRFASSNNVVYGSKIKLFATWDSDLRKFFITNGSRDKNLNFYELI